MFISGRIPDTKKTLFISRMQEYKIKAVADRGAMLGPLPKEAVEIIPNVYVYISIKSKKKKSFLLLLVPYVKNGLCNFFSILTKTARAFCMYVY